MFLLRSELDPFWDYRVFVSVDFEIALQWAILRDLPLFGSSEAIQTRYRQRYFPGQRIYLQTVRPLQHANAIVENNDLAYPVLKAQRT